jgi:hypothetical protein
MFPFFWIASLYASFLCWLCFLRLALNFAIHSLLNAGIPGVCLHLMACLLSPHCFIAQLWWCRYFLSCVTFHFFFFLIFFLIGSTGIWTQDFCACYAGGLPLESCFLLFFLVQQLYFTFFFFFGRTGVWTWLWTCKAGTLLLELHVQKLCILILTIFLVIPEGVELRTLCLLGRPCTSWATLPALQLFVL